MTLYEINEEYEAVLAESVNEDGEIDEAAMEKLNQIAGEKNEKIENIVLFIKNLEAEADAIGAEAKKLTARAKITANKANYLKNYLEYCLKGEKFKTPKCSVTYRMSKSVECGLEDVSVLPEEFLRVKYELNKTAVKEKLQNGEYVDGCILVDKCSMIIK